jgi:hypothetical protein
MVFLSLVMLAPALQLANLAPQVAMRSKVALSHPWYQLDNEEGALLSQAIDLARGRSFYRKLTDYPLVAGTYPPLYMALCSLGVDAANPDFSSGRLITASACLGIAFVLFSTVLFRTRHLVGSVLASLLFVVSFEAYNWVAYYRVDMLALFLSLLGLGCVILSPHDRPSRVMSIILFTLAFYSKQTMVAAPLAAAVSLFLADRRVGIRYTLWLLAAVAAPFAVLSAMTGGQFAIHTVLYNMNTYHPGDLLVWAKHVGRFYPWLTAAGGLSVAILFVLPNPDSPVSSREPLVEKRTGDGLLAPEAVDAPDQQDGVGSSDTGSCPPAGSINPVPVYMLASLLNFVAIGKAGSAENYLLEPLAAFALGIGMAVGRLNMNMVRSKHWRFSAAMLSLMAAAIVMHGIHVSRWSPVILGVAKNPGPEDFAAAAEVTRELDAAEGEVIAELGGYSLLAGYPVVFQPFIMSELARQGKWNSDPFVKDLRRGRFAVIVTNHEVASGTFTDAYTPEMLDAIRSSYTLVRRIESGRLWKYYVYKPRTASRARMDIVMAAPRWQ